MVTENKSSADEAHVHAGGPSAGALVDQRARREFGGMSERLPNFVVGDRVVEQEQPRGDRRGLANCDSQITQKVVDMSTDVRALSYAEPVFLDVQRPLTSIFLPRRRIDRPGGGLRDPQLHGADAQRIPDHRDAAEPSEQQPAQGLVVAHRQAPRKALVQPSDLRTRVHQAEGAPPRRNRTRQGCGVGNRRNRRDMAFDRPPLHEGIRRAVRVGLRG